ncbi:1848_t:CDS:2, partial [Scutellospora calospora]
IDELLSEVSIDFSKTESLENLLDKLKEKFEKIYDKPDLSIADAKSVLLKNHGIIIPFPDPQPSDDVKYKFGFKKPTAFYLVGSYPLKNVVRCRNGFSVDVVVIMPKYLAVLSAALQDKNSTLNVKVEFGALDGDRHRPTNLLKIALIPNFLFTLYSNGCQISKQQSTDSLPSTPQYNPTILKTCIGGDEDRWSGFNAFVWKMLMCYLLHGGGVNGGKKLANGYSSYQLIKGTMDFL